MTTPCLSVGRADTGTDPSRDVRTIRADIVHGDYAAALDRARKARDAAADAGADRSWLLTFRLLEAEALLMQDRATEAVAALGESPPFPRGGELAIQRHLILSGAYGDLNRPADSDRERHEARRLAESAHSPLIGEVLRAEALVDRNAGRWSAALTKLNASLNAARRSGDRWLETRDLVSLGFINLQNEHYDQSVGYSQMAVEAARSMHAGAQTQQALGNLGWARFCLGEFELAIANFEESERLARNMGDVTSQVRWLQDAGLAEYKLGHLAEARQFDEKSLAVAKSLPAEDEIDNIANIHANLALLLFQQRDYAAAREHSERAAEVARGSKDVNVAAYAAYMQALVAARTAGAADAEPLFLRAHQTTTDLEIRMSVENGLANLHRDRHQPREAESWYRRSIQTFEERRATVQDETLRLSAFAYGDAIYRDYSEFLLEAHRPGEALQVLDRGRARTLEEGLGLSDAGRPAAASAPTDVQAVARRIDAPILFYSLGPEKSHVWVITARDIQVFDAPGLSDIRAQFEAYQREIQKSADPLRAGSPAARGLYDVLVKPAAALIPPGGKVYVVPDGVLHGLNFETLIRPDGPGFKYWIEDATVITASSIRMLARPRAAAGAPGAAAGVGAGAPQQDLLLIGDPVKAAAEFEPLPNAGDEMRRVQGHFDGARQAVFGQARAVPAAYTHGGPERYRYIHFVAHGTASRSSPLDSAVILSPEPGNPDEFKLYARDVVRHPLTARLVTISACNGAGLRTYAGEGLVGLAWAFLRAGAHDVIGALWQADDGATPLIMDRLYADLQAGVAPESALRSAKLALVRGASVYRKPLYWGAFQLYAGS